MFLVTVKLFLLQLVHKIFLFFCIVPIGVVDICTDRYSLTIYVKVIFLIIHFDPSENLNLVYSNFRRAGRVVEQEKSLCHSQREQKKT
ncbi:hypothetical protein D1841_10695 [Neglecta sp. X4]|nr:hypothetical protein [Neglectibacter sp. 59]NBJ73740.1 hypothetical protein [Neglectibacter sp. X4]NCE81432.1 hypothetical protein [Neglectibacter sp. X58]